MKHSLLDVNGEADMGGNFQETSMALNVTLVDFGRVDRNPAVSRTRTSKCLTDLSKFEVTACV